MSVKTFGLYLNGYIFRLRFGVDLGHPPCPKPTRQLWEVRWDSAQSGKHSNSAEAEAVVAVAAWVLSNSKEGSGNGGSNGDKPQYIKNVAHWTFNL